MEYQISINKHLHVAVNRNESDGHRVDAVDRLNALIESQSPVHTHYVLQLFDGLLVPLEQLLQDPALAIRDRASVAFGALGSLKPEPIIHYLFNKLYAVLAHDGQEMNEEMGRVLLNTVNTLDPVFFTLDPCCLTATCELTGAESLDQPRKTPERAGTPIT